MSTTDPRCRSATARLLMRCGGLLGLWLVLRLGLLYAGGAWPSAHQVTVGSHRVAALETSPVEASAPDPLLVVAHGGLASKETLLGLCWEARARGARCWTVDALGHGQSDPLPLQHTRAAMRAALHVEQGTKAGLADTAFIGHSMGAALGVGTEYPCGRAVAIGHHSPCAPDRQIFGDLHRQWGLSSAFYLPISHVLEPWTPSVLAAAVDRALPSLKTPGTQPRIARRVALAWGSLLLAAAVGVVLARVVRTHAPRILRGVLGAGVLYALLSLGAWRTLWWLVPTQRTDALLIGGLLALTLGLGWGLRVLGLMRPVWGVLLACGLTESAAVLCAWAHPSEAMRSLLILPVGLLLPVMAFAALCERLSRGPDPADSLEAALFCTTLLATCLALLVPGV